MWNRSKNRIDNDTLDRFSDELMRAFEANDTEINTAATSPFLFRRIRARIEAEQRLMAEESNPWLALVAQVQRAIPVLALLAVVALASSLYLHQAPATETKAATEQPTLVAGLPAFLQDSPDDVEASLVGWHGGSLNQRKE